MLDRSDNDQTRSPLTRRSKRRRDSVQSVDIHETSEPRDSSIDKARRPLGSSSQPVSNSPRKNNNRPVERPQFISFAKTSDLLIHLSIRIIELMNERDYDSPFLNCLSPDIVSQGNYGRQAVIQGFRCLFEQLPDYHNEIQNSTCTVNGEMGRAKVVMTTRVSGFVCGTMRQSVSLFTWIRTGDRWSCTRYGIIRGIEEFE